MPPLTSSQCFRRKVPDIHFHRWAKEDRRSLHRSSDCNGSSFSRLSHSINTPGHRDCADCFPNRSSCRQGCTTARRRHKKSFLVNNSRCGRIIRSESPRRVPPNTAHYTFRPPLDQCIFRNIGNNQWATVNQESIIRIFRILPLPQKRECTNLRSLSRRPPSLSIRYRENYHITNSRDIQRRTCPIFSVFKC